MKIIVASDSHGRYPLLGALAELHRDADAFIFLGDGAGDVFRADLSQYPFCVYSVRGNCDAYTSSAEGLCEEMTLSLDKYKFFILHGHTRGVKHGFEDAMQAAVSADADVVLFGHTHVPTEKYIAANEDIGGIKTKKPLYLFNPGSIGYSSDGEAHFGIVQIKSGSILFSHGVLKK